MTCQERDKISSNKRLKRVYERSIREEEENKITLLRLYSCPKAREREKNIKNWFVMKEESIHNRCWIYAPLITRHHLLWKSLNTIKIHTTSLCSTAEWYFFSWIWLISLPLSLHKTHLLFLSLSCAMASARTHICEVALVWHIGKKDWRTN